MLPERLDGLLAVIGQIGDVSHVLQKLRRHFLVHRVVFDHKHHVVIRKLGEFAGLYGRWRMGSCSNNTGHGQFIGRFFLHKGCDRFRPEQPQDQGAQAHSRDGFALSRRQTAGVQLFPGHPFVAGTKQRQHGPAQRRLSIDYLGEFESINLGHELIQQNKFVGLASCDRARECLDGRGCAINAFRDGVPALQEMMKILPVGHIIVHDQNAAVLQRGGGFERNRRGFRMAKLNLEPENRALAQGAGDADFTVHQFCQTSADGQAKTGAAKFSGGRIVGLDETLEKIFLHLRRDSDAAILDLKAQPHTRADRLPAQADADCHIALAGEFDGIAHQVQHHLFQPHGISAHPGRQIRSEVEHQLESLLISGLGLQKQRPF